MSTLQGHELEAVGEIREFLLRVSDVVKRHATLRAWYFALVHDVRDRALGVGGAGAAEMVQQEAIARDAKDLADLDEEVRAQRADEFATAFYRAAKAITNREPRQQDFRVLAYVSADVTAKPVTTHPFSIEPSHQHEHVRGLEEPTHVGALAQAQRNTETFMREVRQMVKDGRDDAQRTAGLMLRFVEATSADRTSVVTQNLELQKTVIEMTRALQEGLNQQQTRNIDAKKADYELEQTRRMWRILEKIGLQFADRFAAGPMTDFVRGFAKDRQRLRALHDMLPEPQQLQFREALSVHLGPEFWNLDEPQITITPPPGSTEGKPS